MPSIIPATGLGVRVDSRGCGPDIRFRGSGVRREAPNSSLSALSRRACFAARYVAAFPLISSQSGRTLGLFLRTSMSSRILRNLRAWRIWPGCNRDSA